MNEKRTKAPIASTPSPQLLFPHRVYRIIPTAPTSPATIAPAPYSLPITAPAFAVALVLAAVALPLAVEDTEVLLGAALLLEAAGTSEAFMVPHLLCMLFLQALFASALVPAAVLHWAKAALHSNVTSLESC